MYSSLANGTCAAPWPATSRTTTGRVLTSRSTRMRLTAAQLSGRNSARSSQFAKSVASTIATSDGPPDPAEPVHDDQSHPSVRLLAAHLPTLGTLQSWPGGPAGRPSWSRISSRSLACRESIGRRQLSGMRFWRRTTDTTPVEKISYVTKVSNLGCGVGYYK